MTVQVSEIYLQDRVSGGSARAELRDVIEEQQLLDWLNAWQPAVRDLIVGLNARGVPANQWPQSWHWQWPAKMAEVAGLIAYRGYCVTCEGMTQGLMRLNLTSFARGTSQLGKPLVYVEYLEVAPWNWSDGERKARYGGTGHALLAAAVALSVEEGFKGRMGLHSLPQSEGFYRNACGMTDLGPDAECQGLRYLEMTEAQAEAFLGEEAAE